MKTDKRSGNKKALLIDQVICSASNAAAIFLASLFLSGAELNLYVVLQLIGTTAIGFQRSTFLDPSIVLSAGQSAGAPHAKWVLLFMLPLFIIMGGSWSLIAGDETGLITTALLILPCIQDCLRYKLLSRNRYWPALASDGFWLITLVAGTFILQPDTALSALSIWALSGGMACFFLVSARASGPKMRLRDVLQLGKFQFTEWTLANLTTLVPLFLVQIALPQGSVAAFRLVQTAIGPLNTLSNYVMLSTLLDSSSIRAMSTETIRRTMQRTSMRLVLLTLTYGVCVLLAFQYVQQLSDPQLRAQLSYAVPVVVCGAMLTSPCTPYLGITRALKLQRLTIMPRATVLVANMAATAAGFYAWTHYGVDPLVITTLTTALVTFLTYRLMVRQALAYWRRTAGVDVPELRPDLITSSPEAVGGGR